MSQKIKEFIQDAYRINPKEIIIPQYKAGDDIQKDRAYFSRLREASNQILDALALIHKDPHHRALYYADITPLDKKRQPILSEMRKLLQHYARRGGAQNKLFNEL